VTSPPRIGSRPRLYVPPRAPRVPLQKRYRWKRHVSVPTSCQISIGFELS
jgi:hypothetical protein